MINDDVELIHKILSGDDEAFTALVRKYQKSVHALAWRKVGDFHFAEDITQDVFLQVYKKLSTLKNPNQFAGWLYVTANRLCKNWNQKNKSEIKSIEEVSVLEMQTMSYNRYISDKNKKEGRERRHQIVKQLLAKLPESERTVMTLYYLGEMTAKEIGNFLGVSVNTITSRLNRARKRLEKEEELLVQEILGGLRLPDSLTENIARKVSDVELTPSPTGKPLLPWLAFGAAAVLVTILLLGLSNQYLVRFQKPYSFEAHSEPTIEIVDAPIVLDIDAKPAVRNQAGRADTPHQRSTAGVQVSEPVLAATAQGESLRPSAAQWAQSTGPQGGPVFDIFATSQGVLYAFSPTGTYRLPANATAWMPVDVDASTEGLRVPMTEHQGTLYIVSTDAVFTSTDDGKTWREFCTRPKGNAVGFIITDRTQGTGPGRTMYIALQNKGVFRATDAGEQWTLLNDGLVSKTISTLATIGDTVFAGTDSGLYRLDDSGAWERVLVDGPGSIYALAVSEDNLYVGTGPDFPTSPQIESEPTEVAQRMDDHNLSLHKVFHSADLGTSWTDITPTNGAHPISAPFGISLSVAGKTVLAQGFTRFHSRDGGQTWTALGFDMNPSILSAFPSVAVNENTFYKTGPTGIYRTTDAGESWQLFMDGIVGTGILDLVSVNNILYAYAGGDIVQSTDGGESWKSVPVDANKLSHQPVKDGQFHLNFSAVSRLAIAGNILYVISPEESNSRVFRMSADGNMLIPIQGVPAFEVDVPSTNNKEAKQVHLSKSHEGDDNSVEALVRREHERIGAFSVSRGTLYAEYKRQLFKWKPGDAAWKDTGLLDTGEPPEANLKCGFRLAVSGETLYVGKRDGRLLQSLDAGNSWRDITPNLPFHFTCFQDIVFAGSTVYIATDSGVLASQTGEHWRVIADEVVIDRFAVDGTTTPQKIDRSIQIYGAGDTGVYRLDVHNKWKRISSGVPGQVVSLVVDRDKLYVATKHRGMFHISLDEESYTLSQK